jgi:hypothetical protein
MQELKWRMREPALAGNFRTKAGNLRRSEAAAGDNSVKEGISLDGINSLASRTAAFAR